MHKLFAFMLSISLAGAAVADPEADKKAFQSYYKTMFPRVALQDFANGVYGIDPPSRDQWESLEEFPPYETDVDAGKAIYQGSATLQKCFPDAEKGITQNYPYFDTAAQQVITLPLAVNKCLSAAGEQPFSYKRGKIAQLTAYFAFRSRGKVINVKVPNAAALQAYQEGKHLFYARRGQLNLSCAHCHVDNAGKRVRSDIISPALGHVSHFPVYREKWNGLGTLHRRFAVCNEQTRSTPFEAQSREYRNLEYFLSYMNNGIQLNGPAVRK
ncbi:MAG: sulfur oxidation c-type cytochrome SoxA [Gammaproteobacteria bacterium]|nr:sulfur oxidation c-type cytochrome SoxA [Gammaproteobacteria bacterium]